MILINICQHTYSQKQIIKFIEYSKKKFERMKRVYKNNKYKTKKVIF
jgi:hypothetical protein